MELQYAKRTRLMNPIDDDMMKKMAEDLEFCQEVIWIATGNPDFKVISNHPQEYIKNLQGRSAILDILCVDEKNNYVLIEVQKSDDDNHVKRVRYNTSLITTNSTEPGKKFENITDIISIYISKNDFIGNGLPEDERRAVYHVDRVIRENGRILDNGITEIYVNAKVKDGSDAARLMAVFTENDTYDYDVCPKTSERKWYFKNTEKGASEVCTIVEEIVKEEAEKTARKFFLGSDDMEWAKEMFMPTLSEKELQEIYTSVRS